MNGCDVGVPTPLVAVRVSGYVPPLPDAGVPLSIALPFPLSVNIRPVGSVPDSLKDGVGVPVVVTVKLPAAPTVKIVLLALVIVGAVPPPLPATLNAAIAAAQGFAIPRVALAAAAPAVACTWSSVMSFVPGSAGTLSWIR